jgi:hypothetical protein
MANRRSMSLVAWLITSVVAVACQREAAGEDAPETVAAALKPAPAVRTSHEAPREGQDPSAPAPPRLSSAAEAVIPNEIAGTWEVVEVLLSRQDGHGMYRRGDARLIGRSLSIQEGRVRFSFGGDLDCRQVRWPRRELTWGTLFELAFRRTPTGPRVSIAGLGLKAKRTQPVTVYSLCPPLGSPAPLDEGQWVIEYHPGELLFREDPQYLLRLTRRPDGARPTPASFECTRPRTATQKEICQSHELASWDRSVSRALEDFVKARPEREAEAKLSQAAYVQRRDSCGADVDCIEQEEMTRVGELIQLMVQ